MLSELEVWETMAQMWEHPLLGDGTLLGEDMVAFVEAPLTHSGKAYGLCVTAKNLKLEGLLDSLSFIHDAIREYRKNNPGNLHGPYNWPLTLEGASARAAFCRHQANLIRERKK